MAGWNNQEVGDWGESVVRAALSQGRITSALLDPDLGEDFLIEVAGRETSATGKHPRAALVQVKACFEECTSNEIKIPGIRKTKLMRWSSQQLPVFIIAVSGFSASSPKFFLKAIDEFLEERFSGVEIRDIPTETVTVTAQHTQCVVTSLESGVDAFHRIIDSDLSCLSRSEKRNEHFEVARVGKIQQYGAKVKCVSWSVIWRSSRRPAYFAAMINDLLAQARKEYSNLDVPAYVSFHIYRSQHDLDRNIAVARVQWCDDRHQGFEAIRNVVDRENPKINYEDAPPELHELIDAKQATPECFVEHVMSLAPRLDDFALRLIAAEQAPNGGKDFWTDDAIAEMEKLDNAWEATALAPPQFKTLNDVLSQYVFALTSHRIHSGKADWNLKGENARYRMETTMEIQYYFGAWRVILKCDGWAV